MSKGSTQVKAPDPFKIAEADVRFNRINQFSPLSSLQFYGPERNTAVETLNPALQHTENQRLLSDMMLNNMALGRQTEMKGGSLPSLTPGLDPTSQQDLFGLPNNLVSGSDAPSAPPPVPDFIGDFQQGAIPQQQGKGGQYPGAPQPAAQQPQVKGGVSAVGGQPQMTNAPSPGAPSAKGGAQPATPQQSVPLQAPPAPQPQSDNALFGGRLGSLVGVDTFGLDPEGINRGRTEQAMFDRTSSLLNPGFDQSQERLYQDLANRGIPRDSEAGRRAIADFERNKGETFSRLAQDSITQGGQEVTRQQQAMGQLFGMGKQLSEQDIFTQLQNANIQQANRATQFNELAALLGLNQVAQPGLQNFFAPANADVGGAFALNQAAQQNNANNSQAQKSGILDAVTGLGSAGIMGRS